MQNYYKNYELCAFSSGITTNYVYKNDKLLREVTGSEKIDFIYGSDGIIGLRIGNKNYLYRKNVFGSERKRSMVELVYFGSVSNVGVQKIPHIAKFESLFFV